MCRSNSNNSNSNGSCNSYGYGYGYSYSYSYSFRYVSVFIITALRLFHMTSLNSIQIVEMIKCCKLLLLLYNPVENPVLKMCFFVNSF